MSGSGDILIRGMEMPESCYECRFFVDTLCYAFKADDWRNAYNKPAKGKRLYNCPLVPVPAHGRLIDADALVNELVHSKFFSMSDYNNFVGLALKAPTIIEAEEGE